ncbi:methyltransferase [Candidatus Pacearchaeota archaeon]|nr:methyltransferase [Candidatus Pacearchaeota archaeon]
MAQIYQPEEDSFLIQKTLREELPKLLKNTPNLKFLEIGPGSGIQLETAKDIGIPIENIYSLDKNPDAVKHCQKLGFACIESDLFENIKGKFDIMVFNPPYLPYDKREPEDSQLATTGGKYGGETISKFLKQAKSNLSKNGKIFLLTSSLTKKIDWKNYTKKKIATKKIFSEKLYVWELEQ